MTEATTDPEALVGLPGAAFPPLEDPSVHLIVPAKRRLRFRRLPRDRSFILALAGRDFKLKSQQSVLGPLWLVLQPLALLLAFVVAFRGQAHISSEPYAVFTLVGLSAWSYFQASMTIGTAAMITNLNFVRYTPSPRPAFPVAATLASLPSFAVVSVAAIIGAAVAGHLSLRVLLLPVALFWLLVLTTGVIGISSALAVRYRDVVSALPLVLQVGVFVAPVGYSLANLPPTARTIVECNPLTGVIEAMRWMVLSGYAPNVPSIVISAGLSVALALAGWRIFSRLETTMADEI
jgi:ABC-type polysaccharide/polyol phosphate export permease